MEITRRFHEFLSNAESHSDGGTVRSDLVEELTQIKQLLLKIPSLDNPQNGKIQNDATSIEKSLFSPLRALGDGINECLSQIRLLSLHTLNHKLSISNITRYLKVYFSAIFGCNSISIISEASDFEGHFQRINKQDLKDESLVRNIISEVQKTFSKGANHTWIELSKSPVIANFYPNYNSDRVLVLRFVTQEKDQLFVFLEGLETNAGIAEKFFEYCLHNDFQALLEVVPSVVSQALMSKAKQEGNKNTLVRFLESIKLEYLDMLRSIFLRHLKYEFNKHFEADVTIELEGSTLDQPTEKKIESKRKIQIIVRSQSKIEFKANFSFSLIGIAEDVSSLWSEINHLYKKFQERLFNRLQRKYESQNQNIIALEFDNERKLCYQNQEIPDQLRPYVDIQNFVSLPTTLSYRIVLGKNTLLFLKLEETLEIFSQNKRILGASSLKLDNILVEILVKKSASNSAKINGFTVMFYLANPLDEKKKKVLIEKEIDKLMAELAQGDDKLKSDPAIWDNFRDKMERLSSIRKFEEGDKDLFAILVPKIDKTKQSVLYEYIRDEEIQSLSKGISTKFESHLTGVIDKMVKSNFLMVNDSPKSKKKNRPASSIGNIDKTNDSKKPFTISLSTAEEKIDKSLLIQCENDEKSMETWSFNFPEINDLEKSRFVWWMLDDLNLITEYNVQLSTLCEFMNQIRAGYTRFKNLFHNYSHSLTVMHATYYMLKHAGYKKNFSSLIELGMLIAAYCHDVDHRGHNNAFEVSSKSPIALLYHDKSVLENHHAAVTFSILVKPPSNIFAALPGDQWRDIRKLIISCILATDMKEHFDMIAKLQGLIDKSNKTEEESPKKNGITWSDDDLMLVTGYMIHCADLSGPSKDFDLAYYWATKVNAEFTNQVEEEKKLGLPVTPYMLNLEKPEVLAKGEMQFMKFIIKPLWLKLNELTLNAMKLASDNIDQNILKWEEKYNEAIAKIEESKANNP